MSDDRPGDKRWTPFGDPPDEAPEAAVEAPGEGERAAPDDPPAPILPKTTQETTEERKNRLFRRRELAAKLQARGWSYRRIGKRLDLHPSTVHDDVRVYYREAARFFDAPTYRERLGAAQWDVARQAWKELRRLEALDNVRHGAGQAPLYAAERLACLEQVSKVLERIAKMHGFSGEAAVSITQLNVGGSNGDTVGRSILDGLSPDRRRAVRDRLLELRNAMVGQDASRGALEATVVEAEEVGDSDSP